MSVRENLSAGGVPRASGDKPGGATKIIPSNEVFPAPAGINQSIPTVEKFLTRVPRASGDKPRWAELKRVEAGWSARERG